MYMDSDNNDSFDGNALNRIASVFRKLIFLDETSIEDEDRNDEDHEEDNQTEKYISEKIVKEIPNSLINFLWYLWELHCDPNDSEVHIKLHSDGDSQAVTLLSADKTATQNFGTSINADITIIKEDTRYYMSYRN